MGLKSWEYYQQPETGAQIAITGLVLFDQPYGPLPANFPDVNELDLKNSQMPLIALAFSAVT